ncbi:MAG: TfoX family protein [Chitinophagaceae bacterium]|nr:MAG: TfoX family protein [Chitinophagaceae bacterium]
MASDQTYVDFLVNQIKHPESISARKMFGEYGIYAGDKIFGLICDNKLFIKPTESGRAFIGTPVEAPAYPGAKPSFVIEDRVEEPAWLSELVRLTVAELPAVKPKKRKG